MRMVLVLLSLTALMLDANALVPISRVPCSLKNSNTLSVFGIETRNFSTRHVSSVSLYGSSDNNGDKTILPLSESDQTIVGAVGTAAALVVFFSGYVLKTTGCGLPAGPAGLFGLAEGLSYLTVTALAALSVANKVKTGSGLPAEPGGILGAAEGLSFLAIAVGLVVLALQVTNYGYIPNAVPMEGGMCS